jgi:hypothetical protein
VKAIDDPRRWAGQRLGQLAAIAALIAVAVVLVLQLNHKDGDADGTTLGLVALLSVLAFAVITPRQTGRVVARITNFKFAGIEVGLNQIAAAEGVKPPGSEDDGYDVERNGEGYRETVNEMRGKLRFARLIVDLEEPVKEEDNYVSIVWHLAAKRLLREDEVSFILDLVSKRDLGLAELPEATQNEFLDASWTFTQRLGPLVWDRHVRRTLRSGGWTLSDYPQAPGHREDFLAYRADAWAVVAARVGSPSEEDPYGYYLTARRLAETEQKRTGSFEGPSLPIAVPIAGRCIVIPAIRAATVQSKEENETLPRHVKVLKLQGSLEDDPGRAFDSNPINEDALATAAS